MATKRPNRNLYDTLQTPNPNSSDRNHQPSGRISRETSPGPGAMDQTERERERNREMSGEWRREREMERLKDKTRSRGKEMEQGERNRERDRAPASRGREGEREWRERERRREGERRTNGRPFSLLEIGGERERERKQGDTFPRMRKPSKERDRRMNQFKEDVGRGGTTPLERQKGMEMDDRERERERPLRKERQKDGEGDLQRYRERERERERDRIRTKEEGEKNGGRPMEDWTMRQRERVRESDPGFRERRRERDSEGNDLWSKRERDVDRVKERPKPRQGEREGRLPSPQRKREGERENYSDREGRGERRVMTKEGRRDIRSEGDSDGEKRKEKMRKEDREGLRYQHSRSEGDNDGKMARDRVREKERERQQQRGQERQRYGQRDGEREDRRRAREGVRERGAERDMDRHRERDRRKEREEVERHWDGVRETQGVRPGDRQRQRDMRDPEKEREGTRPWEAGEKGKWTEGDRVRERGKYPEKDETEQRRHRDRRDRDTDPKREGAADRGSRSPTEIALKAPPQAQSSGEWSSDIEGDRNRRKARESYEEKESERESTAESEREVEEERSGGRERVDEVGDREEGKWRVEAPNRSEQRKMWLEPRRGKYSNDSSIEDEIIGRERARDRHTDRRRERRGGEDRGVEQGARREKERQTERGGREEGRERESVAEREAREGVSVDGEEEREAWRGRDKGREEPLSDSDRGREESWQRDREREMERENVTDNTEESDGEEEGGSDRYAHLESEGGSEREGNKMLSVEDGFITVSSGGDEEDEREEEEFEDCKEFWEDGVSHNVSTQLVGFQGSEGEMESGQGRYETERGRREEWTERKEGAVDREGEENAGKRKEKKKTPVYMFCVIGETLPRSKPNQMSVLDQMETEGTNQNPGYGHIGSAEDEQKSDPSREREETEDERKRERNEFHVPKEERSDEEENSRVNVNYESKEREGGEGTKGKVEHPYAEIGPRRDSETEKLLEEWREKQRELTESSERERDVPSQNSTNPGEEDDHHGSSVSGPMTSDGNNPGTLSSEDVAIRIRMSGAWSTAEEAKRHSQAPHMKWAKNVMREILGPSENNAIDDPQPVSQGGQEVSHADGGTEKEEEEEQLAEGGRVSPVYAMVQKTRKHGENSGAELVQQEAEPPLEKEDVRDDEEEVSFNWGEVDLRNVADSIAITRNRNSRFFNAQLYQQYSETAQNREILRQCRSDVVSTSEELPVPLITPLPTAPSSNSTSAPSAHPSSSTSVPSTSSTSISSSPAPSPPPARRPLPPLPPVPHPHSLSHSSSFSSTTSSISAHSLPLPQAPHAQRRSSSPRVSISYAQSPTLWQELPGVRNSNELGEFTEDQRRLQEVRFEVVTSEASYCRSLDIVVEHFVKSKQLGALLTTQDRNWLFSRLADVRAISHSFLSKLEERVESDIMHFSVCDIIAPHCQRFKMVYVPYLTNQSYQDATYQRLMDENHGFKRIVDKLERSPVCQRLPLRSFLILPFQRITRLKLLVQNIVKRTAQGTEEAMQAIKAMKLLEKLIQESNDSITQMKSIESLVSLSAKVDFECRTLPLVSQSRRLVREGAVTEMMDFSQKETERSVYLHLFNDYLLLSLHKEGGRFTVIDHAPVSDLRAENCRVKLYSLQKNLFRLHLTNKALLLRTDTQSDKLRWISALSRPHPVIDYSAAQDFTQMQCIKAVVAQQPDELSMEKADVLLVHQQSKEGWVEGTKLSDRHRGWIPETHLETIASSKTRQLNLLDALKITTATAAV